MLYNQPYGVSDPNAPYINGNPSTGTMGSIPPAASIEYPQREIVNFIGKSAITPSNADLLQLTKGIQSGVVNYGLDVGTVNNIAINPTQALTAYALGQRFLVKLSWQNTSTVTVNVSGLGQRPLVHVDQSPINAWELLVGEILDIAYDGANFQLLSASPAITLNQPRDLYVNVNTGSDTLYDGTSATISGVKTGPFKTVTKALNTMALYNLGGWYFNIHVADGNYVNDGGGSIACPLPNGSGYVNIIGNVANPAACQILQTVGGACFRWDNGGVYDVYGFKLSASGANLPGNNSSGVAAYNVSLFLSAVEFGACTFVHMESAYGGDIILGGTVKISGAAAAHMAAFAGAKIVHPTTPPSLTVSASVNFSNGFVTANDAAIVETHYTSITGAGLVTGPKYQASLNSIIDSGGNGTSYFPGSVAGSLTTGAQYI